MTKGRIDKRQRQDDQRRMKRMQAAGVWLTADKVPPRPIVVGARRSRPSVGFVEATPGPLPPAHYPLKRAALGKPQVPGGT
jgi:hypothetical protein